MVELLEQMIRADNRQSSKGNQLKWTDGTYWYKADYTRYEGLVLELMTKTESKTFCRSFEEQVDIAEELYGEQIHFHFGEKEIRELLEKDEVYPEAVKRRVYTVLMQQRRKYRYLFQS